MKIFLHQIKDQQDTELEFTETEKWLTAAVVQVDEKSEEGSSPQLPSLENRPVHASVVLRMVDGVVVVSGRIKTQVLLVCSRCANPFPLGCNLKFSVLFCKDPVMAGVGHQEDGRPAGQNHGFARHAHEESDDDDFLPGKDLDIIYLSTDFIDLGEVVTEQLRLQIPYQPLCKEECKGMCTQCGADMNVGRCACAKIAKSNPFSVLRDFT